MTQKSRLYFSKAVDTWDADFYVKMDDNVGLNIGEIIIFNLTWTQKTYRSFLAAWAVNNKLEGYLNFGKLLNLFAQKENKIILK